LTARANAAFVRYLIRPARGGAVLVLLVFAPLLTIAKIGGLLALPLGLILTSWFFKYAYILFDSTVRGVEEPPALDIQMLNPLDEQRPLAQLAIVAVLGALGVLATFFVGPAAGIVVAIAALGVLPASVGILGLEGNPLKAINPIAWLRMIQGLGVWYLVLLGLIGAYGLLIEALWEWRPWFILQLLVGLFAILSVFSVLAGALYERRHELGLEAWHSPERKQQREYQEERRQSQRAVDAAYEQVRIGAHTSAWKILQDWLTERGNASEDYRWLCERVATWSDPRYATRMAQDYIDRLLVLRRNGDALDLLKLRLRADPQFRPKTAASTLALAGIAARGGAKGIARSVLGDFAARFPGDPSIPAARRLADELNG
jgi:hypothetical protein